jgi:hypothetical protein
LTQAIDIDAKDEITRDTLSLTSPAPLEAITVVDALGSRRLPASGMGVTLPLRPPPASPVRITENSSSFFSQRTVTIDTAMPSSPRTVVVTLSSSKDYILLDSSFPFVRESPNRYRILIGAFPPNPLELQLTLPAGGAFTLGFAMEFDLPLIGVQVLAPAYTRASMRVQIQKNVEVRT